MEATHKNNIRTCFFGCNTAHGFHTFYDFLPDLDNARIYIVKGGPGTGKSTFIRGIAAAMRENGFAVEQQLCSLDPESLDAVVIPEIRGVVVAATGHHVFDPANPGAVDEIINLGRFWNGAGIRRHARKIVTINKDSDRLFAKAYRYLNAAKQIQDSRSYDFNAYLLSAKLNKITETLINSLFGHLNIADTLGMQRHLFASSITSRGHISHAVSLISKDSRIILLRGAGRQARSSVLQQIAKEGIKRGCLVHFCHTPLDHHHIEHIILPESGTIVSADGDTLEHPGPTEIYDLDSALEPDSQRIKGSVEEEKLYLQQMIGVAIQTLARAKETHGRLERYYVENMDFHKVDQCRDEVITRLLRHANSF